MSHEAYLRDFNRRIGNPRTVSHSPSFYRWKSFGFNVFRIFWGLMLVGLSAALLIFIVAELVGLAGGR